MAAAHASPLTDVAFYLLAAAVVVCLVVITVLILTWPERARDREQHRTGGKW